EPAARAHDGGGQDVSGFEGSGRDARCLEGALRRTAQSPRRHDGGIEARSVDGSRGVVGIAAGASFPGVIVIPGAPRGAMPRDYKMSAETWFRPSPSRMLWVLQAASVSIPPTPTRAACRSARDAGSGNVSVPPVPRRTISGFISRIGAMSARVRRSGER